MDLVFVSHAATDDDPRSWDVVGQVCHGLEQAGFAVFEYRRQQSLLRERWRFGLLIAVEVCHAAVVILDERARSRPWVAYEQSVLYRRASTDRDFKGDRNNNFRI